MKNLPNWIVHQIKLKYVLLCLYKTDTNYYFLFYLTCFLQVVQPERVLDKQTLIEHIVKLQRISARKSEKLDFLEEHVNTLVAELQKKSRLLQSYILREQTGTMTSNSMDTNKVLKHLSRQLCFIITFLLLCVIFVLDEFIKHDKISNRLYEII